MSTTESKGAGGGPVWGGEYPIAQAEEFRVGRRGFAFACCAAVVAGAAGLGAAGYEEDKASWAPFAAGEAAGLVPESDRVVTNPHTGAPVLVVRLKSGELRAYDQRCTHLLCPVHYDAGHEKIFCPCHHGLFDPATGAPAGGPPRRALPSFSVSVRDGMIFIAPPEARS